MNIITKRDKIKDAIENYLRLNSRRKIICDKLKAVNPNTITQMEVDIIIGNDSWTELKCNECERDVNVLVRFGSSGDPTAYICKRCLKISIAAIESYENDG